MFGRTARLESRVAELSALVEKLSGRLACLEARTPAPRLFQKPKSRPLIKRKRLGEGVIANEVRRIFASGPMRFAEASNELMARLGLRKSGAENAVARLRRTGLLQKLDDGRYVLAQSDGPSIN